MQCFSLENGVFTTPFPLYTQNNCSILHYNKNLPYIAYTGCLLEHILHTDSLTNNEKLFYLIADSLSLISSSTATSQRSVTLSSSTWAKKLGCSKTEVFSLQKSLEEKGYFVIIRDTNKRGKNMRNVIIPTLPDSVFNHLSKEPDRFNSTFEDRHHLSMLTPISTTTTTFDLYDHAKKRTYLDKTKLFIKLNYQLLSIVVALSKMSSFAKIVWLDFYSKCYKNHIKFKSYNCDKHLNDYLSFTCSYQELENEFACSKALVSKTIKSLEELEFIKRSRFHVKNDNIDDNLHDKSLWNITVTIPHEYTDMLNANIAYPKPYSYTGEEGGISVYDRYIYDSNQLYNKDSLIKNNDLDNIDKEQKTSDDFVSTSSNLSVFLNNNQKVKKNYYNNDLRLTNTKSLTSSTPSPLAKVGKSLKDFYPLSKKQVDKLNFLSGREFATNFGNQLMLKLIFKYPNKTFATRNHMLSYMTEAFRNEKHQAPLVNHESFRFSCNITNADSVNETRTIERYLTEIELSRDVSKMMQLRRKLIGAFSSTRAYEIILNTQVFQEEEGILIKFNKNLGLSDKEEESFQNAITTVFGNIDIDIKYFQKALKIEEARQNPENQYVRDSSSQTNLVQTAGINEHGNTHKLRQGLIEELGCEVDSRWFSDIQIIEDEANSVLNILSDNKFSSDWKRCKYGHVISRVSKELGFKFVEYEY